MKHKKKRWDQLDRYQKEKLRKYYNTVYKIARKKKQEPILNFDLWLLKHRNITRHV